VKPVISPEEMQRRREHVKAAIADSRIEGLPPPSRAEQDILDAYIRGEIEARDLVKVYKQELRLTTEPLSSQDKAEARRRLLSAREPIADLAKEYNRCVAGFLHEIAMPRRRRNRLSVAECRQLSDHFHSAFRLSRLTYGKLFGISFEGVLEALEIAKRRR
jgi:hypothetical protein